MNPHPLLRPTTALKHNLVKPSLFSLLKRTLSTTPTPLLKMRHFDAIIIGSGQSGTPLASALAKSGKKTALIESTHIGGCCVNEGCSPTKTMIASGRVAYLAKRSSDYGVHFPGPVTVDMNKVKERKQAIVDSFRGGNEKRTKDAGVEIIYGVGSFKDDKTVVVNGEELGAVMVFINVGERPSKPRLDGVEGVPKERLLDSTSIQNITELPGHLLVLGGGYIGLEFGQLFRRLGADVTIIQRGKQLLPREDADVAECMLEILRQDGITVHLNTTATSISSTGDSVELTISTPSGTQKVTGSHVLSAAGRTPNTDTLNLSAAGITTKKSGHIECNETLETNIPNIYVMGDAKGPPAFTHISYDDYRIIKQNVIDKNASVGTLSTKDRIVPYVVYTDPQLGHVGLHESEARKLGKEIKVAKMPMSWVARALETDETRGMMKAVVDARTGQILGFTCLGLEGGEVMSIVQTAMMGGLRWEKLKDAVWAHPTLAEGLNNLWGSLE